MILSRNQSRQHKHMRIRHTIQGTAQRPRICVFKSLKHFEVQLIDDAAGKTLVQNSTLKLKMKNGGNVEAAKKLGETFAKQIKELKVENVVFDRSGYIYHGRVAAFVEALRKEGIKI